MTLANAVAELDRRALVIEAPGGLWHLRARGAGETFCGLPAPDWPAVMRWAERSGVTCGTCLAAAGVLRPGARPRRV